MAEMFAYAIVVVILILFLSGISYYIMLFFLRSELKKNNFKLWSTYRTEAKSFETELMTTYKIMMKKWGDSDTRLNNSEKKLAKAAKCNLYVSMSLFMLVLAVGLIVSVHK